MELIPVQLQVPKESKEVVDLLVQTVQAIRAKKPAVEIALGSLTALTKALDGWDQVPGEVKSANKDELAGYMVQQVMDALGI